ncbi:formate dehydrogenase subunit delta [Halomonas sp. M4R1S46]|uniref:formate dehydrogenase subunit delta n=1 Tax=Halomonas sp. M4R1S46 TaxID=2982692 RepID=UPI0021E4CA59|nr:formate dehydrogenase subunit delta [Halomonas sp. M4R1S46]UYG08809.1 formate dehydrogenase subunit delta [Halomonas sp. M4R1S46]
MSRDHVTTLVQMVNQIAINLGAGREATQAAQAVCTHLETFWARPMKQRLIACLGEADHGLSPLAREAVARLADRQSAKAG